MNHLGTALAVVTLALLLIGCGETTFKMADGETLVWEEQRGDWVFVNYWAEWCKPCYEEIPELNRLDKQSGVTVLGVNYDGEKGESLRSLMQDMGIEFRVFQSDPAGTFGWDRPVSLPATMIMNPQGELLEARLGRQSYKQLMGVVE
mgnify:CR=1 FL=1